MKSYCFLSITFILLNLGKLSAQSGSLDDSFGAAGKTTTHLYPGAIENGFDIGLQPDGKIIVKGFHSEEHQDYLLRYNFNGTIDSSFGNQGQLQVGGILELGNHNSMIVDDSGRILVLSGNYVLGESNFMLYRYTSEGLPDNTFGISGCHRYYINQPYASARLIKVRPDGKMLISGVLDSDEFVFITCIAPDGIIDDSYGQNGTIIVPIDMFEGPKFYTIGIQPDNKVVIAGTFNNYYQRDIYCIRIDENGTIDNQFGTNGKVTLDFNENKEYWVDLVVQPDSKIVISCTEDTGSGDFAVARFNTNGQLDNTFGEGGKRVIDLYCGGVDYCRSICLQIDGKILLTGESYCNYYYKYDFSLVSLNPDGSMDSDFGNNGVVEIDFNFLKDGAVKSVIQDDNRIITIGSGQIANNDDIGLCRILTTLYLKVQDFSTTSDNIFVYPNPIKWQCNLSYELPVEGNIKVELYSMDGNMIKKLIINQFRRAGINNENLDFSDISVGNYILKVSNGTGIASVQVIKL